MLKVITGVIWGVSSSSPLSSGGVHRHRRYHRARMHRHHPLIGRGSHRRARRLIVGRGMIIAISSGEVTSSSPLSSRAGLHHASRRYRRASHAIAISSDWSHHHRRYRRAGLHRHRRYRQAEPHRHRHIRRAKVTHCHRHNRRAG